MRACSARRRWFALAVAGSGRQRLHWAFYFFEAAMVHVLTEAGIVDRDSDGRCSASDLIRIFDEMVPFFTKGFERL